jgi:hypothetical protein
LPSLFVGNFDFEHRLAYGNGPLPQRLEAVNARLASAWLAIVEPGDAVWIASRDAAGELERLAEIGLQGARAVFNPAELTEPHRVVFWGENDWAVEFAKRSQLEWRGCDPAIVRRVNSRRFKHQLETTLSVMLDGASCTTSIDELASAVETLAHRGWVLKGEFGGAGRDVRFGAGAPSKDVIAWASNRFRHGLAVTVEPRLERVDEAGIQFEIHRNGRVEFLGVTPLLTRPNGGYLGSGFRDDPSLIETWMEAIKVCSEAARRVAAEGYFGPLGIDAMRYRGVDGAIQTRAIQDLNARYTMGRLALGLRRFPDVASKLEWIFRPSDIASQIQSGGMPPA